MRKTLSHYFAVLILGLFLYSGAHAQTSAFSYQGSLSNSGVAED